MYYSVSHFSCFVLWFRCCWGRTQSYIMPSLTNITSSRFGHNLDVVIPEFILSASGCEVEGTERKHLWGLVLTPLPRDEHTWRWPSDEVAGVLTPTSPKWKVKTLSQCPPSLPLQQQHRAYGQQQNFCSFKNGNTENVPFEANSVDLKLL